MKFWTNDRNNKLKKIIGRLSVEDGKYICRVIYKDPFIDIYPILLILYVIILGIFLLLPFDFNAYVRNDARWLENSKGIEFLKIGKAVSNSPTQEFFDRLVTGSGLTLEMWLQTEDLNQSGPARILSYSVDTKLRNFTIGQSRDQLVVRLRTTETNLNGMNPHLIIDGIFSDRNLQHMVIIYDFLEQRVYINGEQMVRSKILKGNFSNWDPSCSLIIGNEVTGNRPWKGKIYYTAVFDRPLTEQEIRRNYLSGFQLKTNTRPPVLSKKENAKHTDNDAKGPLVRYLLDEGKAYVIHDDGLFSNHVDLSIPKYFKRKTEKFLNVSVEKEKFLNVSIEPSWFRLQLSDIILNIYIFVPLGILIHGMLRSRHGLKLKISLVTLLAGSLFTISVELLQHFSMTRTSSLVDVFLNIAGVVIGIMIDRSYNLFLNYQADRLQILLYRNRQPADQTSTQK